MIRVLLADGDQQRRAALRAVVAAESGLHVVGEAGSGQEAAALAHRADVVVLDADAGQAVSGQSTTEVIAARPGGPRVVVVVADETDVRGSRALELGATGCLVRGAEARDVVDVLRSAARGEVNAACLVEPVAPVPAAPPSGVGGADDAGTAEGRVAEPGEGVPLSTRELEVLAAVATGATNRQAAAALFLSEATVKSHLSHAYGRLGVDSREAAVAEARRRGWI